MARVIQGSMNGKGKRFAIVVGRFNDLVTQRLLDGAIGALERMEVAPDDITVVWVPGAREITVATRKLAQSKDYHALICLGAVVRGQTPHFDYVAGDASAGTAAVASESGIPVTFGVLTCDTMEQAIDRAGGKAGNKGAEAAEAAVEMASLLEKI